MNCTNCINKGRLCLSCDEGKFYAPPPKKRERQLSAWEKAWIRWAEKEAKKCRTT